MQQAACQYSATNVTSFNCIVFDVLREDRGNLYQAQFAGSGGPVPPMWWFSARELAILSWPSTSALGSGNQACDFHSPSLAWKHFGAAVTQCLVRPEQIPVIFFLVAQSVILERTLYIQPSFAGTCPSAAFRFSPTGTQLGELF